MSGIGSIYGSNNYTVPISNVGQVTPVNTSNNVESSAKVKPVECQTCKSRKYVDGSNENVSFKTPGHISPEASFSRVSAHEGEHVSNAVSKAASSSNVSLISASVTLKMGVCPECGRTFVAGGVTNTSFKYEESNPYENQRKQVEGSYLKGLNVDEKV